MEKVNVEDGGTWEEDRRDIPECEVEMNEEGSMAVSMTPEAEEILEEVQGLISGDEEKSEAKTKPKKATKKPRSGSRVLTRNKKTPPKPEQSNDKVDDAVPPRFDLPVEPKKTQPSSIKLNLQDKNVVDSIRKDGIILSLELDNIALKHQLHTKLVKEKSQELDSVLKILIQNYSVPDGWVFDIESGEFVSSSDNK